MLAAPNSMKLAAFWIAAVSEPILPKPPARRSHRNRQARQQRRPSTGHRLRRRRHPQRSRQRPGRAAKRPSRAARASSRRHRQRSRQRTRTLLGHSQRRGATRSRRSARHRARSGHSARTARKSRYFLSVAGAGPDGSIIYAVDLELKARMGILAYWWQGAREVFNYKFQHFRVTSEGRIARRLAGHRRPHQTLRRPIQNHHRSRPL